MHIIHKHVLAALALTLTCASAQAGGKHSYTDHARVLTVEPVYRYVTVKNPQRVCSPAHRNKRSDYPTPRHGVHYHKRHYSPAASVFVGGVIGGAIGREVSRSVNGSSSTGVTIAGATIGSAIAHTRIQGNARNQNHGAWRSSPSHLRSSNRQNHGHHRHQRHRQPHDGYSNQRNRSHHNRQRCTTTTHRHQERRADGFNVTYAYKGRTFKTHTTQHPGNSIEVQVTLAPR